MDEIINQELILKRSQHVLSLRECLTNILINMGDLIINFKKF